MQRKAARPTTVCNLRRRTQLIVAVVMLVATIEVLTSLLLMACSYIFLTFKVFFSGWAMFMPCWQLGVKARTSWEQCRAGRGDLWSMMLQGKVFYCAQICSFWHQSNIMIMLLTIFYWRLYTPLLDSRGDLNSGASYSNCIAPWPH